MDNKRMPEPDPRRAAPGPDGQVQGEGDYISARKYQKEQHQFAENEGLVKKKAREAADAIESVEGEELEKARQASAQRGRTGV